MENLNNVPSTGTFGGSVSTINSNFDLVVNAINSLEYQTTRSKGILNYGQNPATVFPNAVAGDWCMILSEGNVFPATIKTYNGSTWSGSGTWNPDGVDLTGYAKTTDMTTAIANSLAQATARMGYGECTVSGTELTVSIPNFILPTKGGTIHLKMSAAGTGASTLNINNTGAKTLWYNGAAVSSTNTWEAGEIISVFYDGTRFIASNSQGGGGAADKISYNNSQSGLASQNVQGALDEVGNIVVNNIIIDNNYNFKAHPISAWFSSTTWLQDSTSRRSYLITRDQSWESFTVTANSNQNALCVLLSETPVNGTTTGYIDFYQIAKGTTSNKIHIPDNCVYIAFAGSPVTSSGTDTYTPTNMAIYGRVSLDERVETLEQEVSEFEGAITEEVVINSNYNIKRGTSVNAWFSASGGWLTDSTTRHSYVITRDPAWTKIGITANSGYSGIVGILNDTYTEPVNGKKSDFISVNSISAGATGVISLPDDCAYIVIAASVNTGGDVYTPSNMVIYGIKTDKERITTLENCVQDGVSESDLDITDNEGNVIGRFSDGGIKTKNFDSSLVSYGFCNHWKGKNWYGFGTSMTDTVTHDQRGKYPIYLAKLSGMIWHNKGIGSAGYTTYSNQEVYNLLMSSDLSDADLITIEIGANDGGAPIGTPYDGLPGSDVTDNSTLCGALNLCIRHLQATTNAQIVVISSPTSRKNVQQTEDYYGNERWGVDEHTILERNIKIENVCWINSVYFIPYINNMGYARINSTDIYNIDWIHHTNLGGLNMAMGLWSILKDIPLFYTSIPNEFI